MGQVFNTKTGDTAPNIETTCRDGLGAVVNVTAATVLFKMRSVDSDLLKVNAAGNIVNGAGGVVDYAWTTSDVDTPGTYRAEFEVTFSSGKVQTFPRPEFITVEIGADLDYVA